ncbi:hypothetical protein cypCar_00033476, partial [Cyprinus carpio]
MKLRSHTRKNCFAAAEMTAVESSLICSISVQSPVRKSKSTGIKVAGVRDIDDGHYGVQLEWVEKEEVTVATAGPQRNRMDRLLEILNSMRNNSSGVENQLTTFMVEAQNSADSEETLNEIVHTIYRKAVSDRSFAATAAKLCDKMALFMVEGTKFRSLLLNMLQVRT